jgi:hypothetical protein
LYLLMTKCTINSRNSFILLIELIDFFNFLFRLHR